MSNKQFPIPISFCPGGGGSGTVTSVTFTGDGTVLSSTPSSAVTTSGTLPATLANANANTVLGNATGSSAAPTYGQIVNGQITNGTIDLTAKVTGVLPAANGGMLPIFSTAVTGVSTANSGTNTVLLGPVTMTTPAANGAYRFEIQVIQTTPGSGGTCTSGTVGVNLAFKDADTGVTYSIGTTFDVVFYPYSNNPASTVTLTVSGGANSASNNWNSIPRTFRAASGTAIQYQVFQGTNSNCTTPAVIAVRPVLYYLGY